MSRTEPAKWALDELIDDRAFTYEQKIARDPRQFDVWWDYYTSIRQDSSLHQKVFVLDRAAQQFPDSFQIWEVYLNLVQRSGVNAEEVKYLFERALLALHEMPDLWVRYLEFMMDKNDATETQKAFNKALIRLPVQQHGEIWPLYINFADNVGGPIGIATYTKYLKYVSNSTLKGSPARHDELSLNIADIIRKLVGFGDWQQSGNLVVKMLYHPEEYRALPFPVWTVVKRYLHAVELMEWNEDLSRFHNNFVAEVTKVFPDHAARIHLNAAKVAVRENDSSNARFHFSEGLATAKTPEDFSELFDAYAEFEEETLTAIDQKMSSVPDDDNLAEEFELRASNLEILLEQRPIMLNDMTLRNDPDGIDAWFERVDIFREKKDISKALSTYAQALSTINPLKAHSASGRSLSELWIQYATEYSSKSDYNTANFVFTKSLQSQFQTPDDLAKLYLAWAELHVSNDDYPKAVASLEQALELPQDHEKIDYKDNSIDIHRRIHKSRAIWQMYLDLLESMVAGSHDADGIANLARGYQRLIDLKIATTLTIFQYADFYRQFGFIGEETSVYELGLRVFKDWTIKLEIWNVYLSRSIERNLTVERLRDLFEQCLYGYESGGDSGCPPELCFPMFTRYSQYEKDHGSLNQSLKVMRRCIGRLTEGLGIANPRANARTKMLNDKVDAYRQLISGIETSNDPYAMREVFEMVLDDRQLKLHDIIAFGRLFADFEMQKGQVARAREVFKYLGGLESPLAPSVKQLWQDWENLEVSHGNEATFKEMFRFKKSIEVKFADIDSQRANPMGFVRSTQKNNEKRASEKQTDEKQANPDEIDIEM